MAIRIGMADHSMSLDHAASSTAQGITAARQTNYRGSKRILVAKATHESIS